MKRFSFRLERVLDYRNYLEKRAQMGLADAKNAYLHRQETVRNLIRNRAETAQKRNAKTVQGMTVSRYQIYRSFLRKLDNDLLDAKAAMVQGAQQVEEKTEDLKKESVRKKALEMLKEKKYQLHRTSQEKEIQQTMDEFAVLQRRQS